MSHSIFLFFSFLFVSLGMYVVFVGMNPMVNYVRERGLRKTLLLIMGICLADAAGVFLQTPAFSAIIPVFSTYIIYVHHRGRSLRFGRKIVAVTALTVGTELFIVWHLHVIGGGNAQLGRDSILILCLLFTAFLQVLITHAVNVRRYRRERWRIYYLTGCIRTLLISVCSYALFRETDDPVKRQILVLLLWGVILHEFFLFYYFEQVRKLETESRQRIDMPANRDKYYLEMEEEHQKIRRLYHDMKNQMMVMQEAAEVRTGDVSGYLKEAMEQISGMNQFYHTGNPQLDIFLHESNKRAEYKGISFHAVIQEHSMDFMSSADIKAIFVNAVANAIEACEKIRDGEKKIEIMVGSHANDLIMTFVNTKNPGSTRKDLDTTKTDGGLHGLGLLNIQRAVDKYDGYMTIDDEERRFCISILLIKEAPENA